VLRANLTIKVTAPDTCPSVFVDQRRTAQSLINLISNAIKFTPAGGSLEVSVEPGVKEHEGFVLISVKDTGCGIAPADIGKVFGYFVQVGPADKQAEGTGLGLSLARSMVEIQGGTMWVTSKVGEGSKFSFTVPVHVPGQTPAPGKDAAKPRRPA